MPATITLRIWAKFKFASPNGNARECIVFFRIVHFRNARASILRKGIHRISRINEAGATNGQKAFDFTNRFGDHAVRLAGVKLALQLNKGVISPIKPAC